MSIPSASIPPEPSAAAERAAALFEYLTKLVELRSRPVRDITEYEEHIWFSDIPDEPEVVTALDATDGVEEWVAVKRPRLQERPQLPAELVGWVDSESLLDPTSPLEMVPSLTDQDGSPRYPSAQTRDAWDRYRGLWDAWARERRRLDPIFHLYQRLFEIEQKGVQFGEQYEIVLGLGLLYTQSSTGPVRRHLITARGKIDYDATTGRIALIPDPDGIDSSVEADMLDASMTAPADVAGAIRAGLNDVGSSLLDVGGLEPLLTTWINSVSTRGSVDPSLAPPTARPTIDPAIVFAPAIILRRRTQRSLIAFYRALIAAFREGTEPPPLVRGLVEILEAEDQRPPANIGEDVETFFPLPANDEQQRIVERLRSNRGVAVAGPPGTGKSHTIANLVSDALAHGRRVVVTSHTARALEVLVEKLPDDIRDLCVIMAGEGRGLSAELRRSVDALLNRASHPDWTAERVDGRIKTVSRQLAQVEGERVEVLSERRRLREAASQALEAPFGGYEGTLSRIAEQLSEESVTLGWIPDEVTADPPMSSEVAREWLSLERRLGLVDLERASKPIPEAETFPDPGSFHALVDELADAEEATARAEALRSHHAWSIFHAAAAEERAALRAALVRLRRERDRLRDDREPWIAEATSDVLAGREQPWIARQRSLQNAIATLKDLAAEADSVRVAGLDAVDLRSARRVVTNLLDHVAAGKGFGFGPLRPQPVRDAESILRSVTVDGAPPKTTAALRTLYAELACRVALDDLAQSWADRLSLAPGSMQVSLGHLMEVEERLVPILALQEPLDEARTAAAKVDDLETLPWNDAERLRQLEDVVGAVDATQRRDFARRRLDELAEALRPSREQTSVGLALSAIERRDTETYAQAYEGLLELQALKRDVARRAELFESMAAAAPSLAGAVRDQPDAAEWDGWFGAFEEAWWHSRVVDWVRKQSSDGGANELDARLARLDVRQRQLVAQLGALRAWRHTLGRLTQAHKANLTAYRIAMGKYGKGTGKHAASHLAAARQYMHACVDAVPSWILPTYRLAESLKPGIEPFDLAIVDEASQSGVEGLFIWALAKQVIVVGDDQQISPDAVGIDLGEVQRLQQQLIPGIPFSNLFSPTTSIFDQALLRYPGQLQLREHFRCMPEIIKFSNDLCYQSSPLQPVRQFGSDRLEPLVPVHVEGAEEKDGVNRVEAMAVVEKIAECCADPRYRDASMGVISLTGDRQAKFIQRRLIERIGPDVMLKHKIKCGDAYAFQGDQRRVMFLSMVASPSSNGHRLMAQVAKPIVQRFNVAASRAEDQAWLFHSVTANDLSPDCLRFKLLSHFRPRSQVDDRTDLGDVSADERDDRFESLFEQRVYRRIVERGYEVSPQHEVLGFRIDLIVTGGAARLAIECDGDAWHGPEQYEHDTARQRDLERCGWTFVRIVESDFYLDAEEALAPLWAALDRLGIAPKGPSVPELPTHETAPVVEDDRPVRPIWDEPAAAELVIGSPAPRSDQPRESEVAHEPVIAPAPSELPNVVDAETPVEGSSGSQEPTVASVDAESQEDLGLDRGVPQRGPVRIHLRPYQAWANRPLPVLTVPSDAVEAAILRIVIAEGPMTVGRLRRIYMRGIGRAELSPVQRSALNKTVTKLVNERRLAVEVAMAARSMVDWAIRIPGTPVTLLRERGPRALGDVPLSELAEVAKRLSTDVDGTDLASEVLARYAISNPSAQQREYVLRALDPSLGLVGPSVDEEPVLEAAPRAPVSRDTVRATRDFQGVLETVVNEALGLGSRRLDVLAEAWRDDAEVEAVRGALVRNLAALGVPEDIASITSAVRDRLPGVSGRARGAVVDLVIARFLGRIADGSAVALLAAPWDAAQNADVAGESGRSAGVCVHGRPWGSCRVLLCPGHAVEAMPADYDWRVE